MNLVGSNETSCRVKSKLHRKIASVKVSEAGDVFTRLQRIILNARTRILLASTSYTRSVVGDRARLSSRI